MTEEEVNNILKIIPHTIKRYKAGSMIAQSGDEVKALRIVTSGVVKGEMVDYSGRVIKIEDVAAPGALAAAFIFGPGNRFPVNVIAVTDAELLIIEKPGFLKLLMKEGRVLINFLDMISNRSQFLSEKIKFLNFKTIRSKLAQFILKSAGGGEKTVILGMKQDDLAEFFGVARPSVARALGELESEGLIEAKCMKIKILDESGLEDLTTD
jgi:CRP-like cAMP-binding protein